MYKKNNAIFAQLLVIFGAFLSLRALILFIQTLALYKSFTYLLTYFFGGSNHSSQNAGMIANKFQFHTYFRFG